MYYGTIICQFKFEGVPTNTQVMQWNSVILGKSLWEICPAALKTIGKDFKRLFNSRILPSFDMVSFSLANYETEHFCCLMCMNKISCYVLKCFFLSYCWNCSYHSFACVNLSRSHHTNQDNLMPYFYGDVHLNSFNHKLYAATQIEQKALRKLLNMQIPFSKSWNMQALSENDWTRCLLWVFEVGRVYTWVHCWIWDKNINNTGGLDYPAKLANNVFFSLKWSYLHLALYSKSAIQVELYQITTVKVKSHIKVVGLKWVIKWE